MRILKVSGAQALNGEIKVQGSKNAALPMLAAALLTCEEVVLHNCPNISDVQCMIQILKVLGCRVKHEQNTVIIRAGRINNTVISEELAGSIRASVLFLGALIGREGYVGIAFPGGCEIGERPIDIHLNALKKLGVIVRQERNLLFAKGHIIGQEIQFRYPSVGATENILLASVCADGETKIVGAAREPEVVALCELLNAMGANIDGIGSRIITIRGVRRLHGVEFEVPGDRIAAGTFALATIATGGKVGISGIKAADIAGQYMVLEQARARMNFRRNTWYIDARQKPIAINSVKAEPFPGFPTDLQSPFLAAMLKAEGVSKITDTVYPNRFKIVKELCRLGADIYIYKNTAVITGVGQLHSNRVCAEELRGAAGLVIAGLQAEGDTHIVGVEYLERGYEDICRDMSLLGAKLTVIESL